MTFGSMACAAFAATLLFASESGAQTPADEFADFRIPDHRWQSGSADFSGSFSRQRNSGYGIFSQRGEFTSSNARVNYRRSRDSDHLQHTIGADVRFLGRRSWERIRSDSPAYDGFGETDDRFAAAFWDVSGEVRRYLGDRPIAVEATVLVSGRHDRAWRWERDEIVNPPPGPEQFRRTDFEDRETLYREQVSLAFGFGRVRDATGIYDAYVLEQRLIASGALAGPLAPELRQKVAAMFYVSPRYSAAHDNPDRYFWRDLERVLREGNALAPAGADGYSALRALERGFPDRGVLRLSGFFVGPVVDLQHFDSDRRRRTNESGESYFADTLTGSFVSSFSAHFEDSDEQIAIGAQAELHRPINLNWQLDAEGRGVIPMLHVRKGLDLGSSARLAYLVPDRWSASAFVGHDRSYEVPDPGRGAPRQAWNVRYGVGVEFYLEDRVKVRLDGIETQIHDDFGTRWRRTTVSVGLSYAFLRGLDAPGLIEPVRPLR